MSKTHFKKNSSRGMREKIGDDKDEPEVGPTSAHLNLHQSSAPISLFSPLPFRQENPDPKVK